MKTPPNFTSFNESDCSEDCSHGLKFSTFVFLLPTWPASFRIFERWATIWSPNPFPVSPIVSLIHDIISGHAISLGFLLRISCFFFRIKLWSLQKGNNEEINTLQKFVESHQSDENAENTLAGSDRTAYASPIILKSLSASLHTSSTISFHIWSSPLSLLAKDWTAYIVLK